LHDAQSVDPDVLYAEALGDLDGISKCCRPIFQEDSMFKALESVAPKRELRITAPTIAQSYPYDGVWNLINLKARRFLTSLASDIDKSCGSTE
jgi:hypothetical protein